jgi:hypothetical protein
MRLTVFLTTVALSATISASALYAQDNVGLPPRATPSDYQSQVKAGKVTIGAEFSAHSLPSPEGPLSTEDFVVVEIGLFGPPDTKLFLSPTDFSLRINGKKMPTPASPYGLILKSLKDPTWEAPELKASPESKSKGGITSGGGGGGGQTDTLPPIVHVPIDLQRSWNKRAQKASLPEGDRPLPQAGFLYFEHSGKVKSVELIYNGPAGKATLNLQP